MKRFTHIAIAISACAVLASALGVIWTKHQTRSSFIELQGLTAERDRINIEWGQLKLEQSAWATHGRVEKMARADLKLVIPRAEEVRLVQP
jgi:cell division protein FtsL